MSNNLLSSPSTNTKTPHWASLQEAGTLVGLRFLFLLYRCCGRRVFSLLMYPVACYFVLFRPVPRRASLMFLRRHWHINKTFWRTKPNWLHVVNHFAQFAETILDKSLAWCLPLEESEFVIDNHSIVNNMLSDTRGQLIIGTHFGNLEYSRGFMQHNRIKVINILVYDKHSKNFAALMRRLNENSRLHVFQVDEFDVSTILLLKQKIAQGEWVFIAGDRVPLNGLERTVEVDFLGHKAPLPMGPYLLAKALECPVKLLISYRYPQLGKDKIRLEMIDFAEKIVLSRRHREQEIQAYAQSFIHYLEPHCLQSPYQWFNFYDFWAGAHKIQANHE